MILRPSGEKEGEKTQVRVNHPRCPYCHDDIRGGEDNRACHACLTWHHSECWAEGGCVTCGGEARTELEPVEEERTDCWIHDPNIDPTTKMDLFDLWRFDIETLATQCTCAGPLPVEAPDLGDGNDAARLSHLIVRTNARLNSYREKQREEDRKKQEQRRLAERAAKEDMPSTHRVLRPDMPGYEFHPFADTSPLVADMTKCPHLMDERTQTCMRCHATASEIHDYALRHADAVNDRLGPLGSRRAIYAPAPDPPVRTKSDVNPVLAIFIASLWVGGVAWSASKSFRAGCIACLLFFFPMIAFQAWREAHARR